MDIEYFAGGFDPNKPGSNVHVTVEHHGDGTGTRTVYDESGQVVSTEAVSGLPVDTGPPPLPLADEVEAARTLLGAAATVAQTKARALALDDLRGQQLAAITQGDTP